MSTSVMAMCWPLQMPPTPKAVLISLADNANDHGECWPSISKIAERTCFGRTAVIEAIKWLEDHSALHANRTNGRHTSYTVTPQEYQSVSRTGTAAKPVRMADATSPSPGRDQSVSRTAPVRQADTNHQEPSLTVKSNRHTREPNGTRLPDGWRPSEAVSEWARQEYPGVNLISLLAEFSDYWRAIPGQRGRKADWDATFRNRVRAVAANRGSHATPTHRESAAERVARKNAEAEAREAGDLLEHAA